MSAVDVGRALSALAILFLAFDTRVGSPLLTHALFGVYLGLFVWGGLYLRNARLRELIPAMRWHGSRS